MAKVETINKYTEVKQKTNKDIRTHGPIVGDRDDSQVTTAGQQYIDLAFSVTIINRSLFFIEIDGNGLRYGDDYEFSNIVSGTSARVKLLSPAIADLNIDYWKVGVEKENFPNPSSVQATLNNDVGQPLDWSKNGFSSSVKEELYDIPYSSYANIDAIENRANIKDHSQMLKPMMGIERLAFGSIDLLQSEFGPSNERVYEVDTKDSRIRFVGSWVMGNLYMYGTYVVNGLVDDYVEISFYGTGLNVLMGWANVGDLRATVDNGTEGTTLFSSVSSVMNSRNYRMNTVIPVASGLTLGWHTVKLRSNSAGNNVAISGAEVLNESSSLKISQGKAFDGCKREELSAVSSSDYANGVSGTKGARVCKYLKDGVISEAVQEVDATALYLTNTDHSNEVVSKRLNWREFGAGRTEDFTNLSTSTSDRMFTLDDGTTTLVGDDVRSYNSGTEPDVLGVNTSGAWRLAFVGTGLDIFSGGSVGTYDAMNVHVDGTLVGTITGQATSQMKKLCSGLPYGSHVVKITRIASVGYELYVKDFVIYQPKKPTLPEGAIEICDYNVVADFVESSTYGVWHMSQGVVRKNVSIREAIYSGSWTISNGIPSPQSIVGGWQVYSSTTGNYMEYTFVGTGFDFRGEPTTASSATVTIDGTVLTATNFPTASFSTYGGYTYTSSTGVVSGNANGQYGSGFNCSGLPYGKHTVRFTLAAASNFWVNTLDIIVPIHVNNTSVGSLALNDSRNFSPIPKTELMPDWSKAKALLFFDGSNNIIRYSKNISAIIDVSTGTYHVYFKKKFKNQYFITMINANDSQQWVGSSLGSHAANLAISGSTGTMADATMIMCAFFGELEDEE